MLSHQLRYPLPKLTLALIAGIMFQDIFHLTLEIVSIFVIVLGIVWIITQFKTAITKKIWGHWASLMLVICFGDWCGVLNQPTRHSDHYSHMVPQKNKTLKPIVLQVNTILNPTRYNLRFYANIVQWDSTDVFGKILLNIKTDSLKKPICIDDFIVLFKTLEPIATPKNPHGFDYAQFLKRKGVTHQISTKFDELIIRKPQTQSLLGWSSALKTKVESNIDYFSLTHTTKAFLKAFFLGNRNEIPDNIKTDYKSVGVLHILALSGLHVGILLLLFRLTLKPLLWIKNGKIYRSVIMVGLLWAFAILTGLSPSIVRAVSMFSCFAIADGINRKTSRVNTLSISAFILLVLYPNYIFDAGFQLSYGAVLGILILKPELDKVFKFKSKILEFFNDTLKVSIAAQIGILPLSLYYFHQFSSLFFVANLLVIPSLMLLIWLGLIVLILNLFGVKLPLFDYGFENGLKLMNNYIQLLSSLDDFVFKMITFDQFMLFLSISLLIMVYKFVKQKSFQNLIRVLIFIAIFQVYYFTSYKFNPKSEFVIFHQFKSTVLGFRSGAYLEIHKTDTLTPPFVVDYITGENISEHKIESINPTYRISNNNLLLIDSLGIYKFSSQKFDWVLMQYSPKIHFETMIETLQPRLVIADGSNYKSLINRWKKTCKSKGVKFYDTATSGAFIYPLK